MSIYLPVDHNFWEGQVAHEAQDEADELQQDELYNAQMVFYDAYKRGNHQDIVRTEEALFKAIERRYNLAEVPCGICHRTECSH